MNELLAKEINAMVKRDQEMRAKVEKGAEWDSTIDVENTVRLKQIVAQYGWPTVELVGKKASYNAWLLAQHADKDRAFQRQVLDLMRAARKSNPDSIESKNIAYLTDRLLVAEGKEQEFGTQFYITDEEKLVPSPIRDRENVNKRREEYGLYPIERDLEDAEHYLAPKKNN